MYANFHIYACLRRTTRASSATADDNAIAHMNTVSNSEINPNDGVPDAEVTTVPAFEEDAASVTSGIDASVASPTMCVELLRRCLFADKTRTDVRGSDADVVGEQLPTIDIVPPPAVDVTAPVAVTVAAPPAVTIAAPPAAAIAARPAAATAAAPAPAIAAPQAAPNCGHPLFPKLDHVPTGQLAYVHCILDPTEQRRLT